MKIVLKKIFWICLWYFIIDRTINFLINYTTSINSFGDSFYKLICNLSPLHILLIAISIVFIFDILLYRPKVKSNKEIFKIKVEYVYKEILDDNQRSILDSFSESDKEFFYNEYFKIITEEKTNLINNNILEKTIPKTPTIIKILKLPLLICLIIGTYNVGKPTLNYLIKYNQSQELIRNETIPDQALEISRLPTIILNGSNSFKNIKMQTFIKNNIMTQPAYLLVNCNKIIISSHENQEIIWKAENVSDYKNLGVRAFASLNEMAIYIENTDDASTITHELSHIFDYSKGNPYDGNYSPLSDSNEFTALYNKYKDTLFFNYTDNSYSRDSKSEFFAVSGTYFLEQGSKLKKECIELYDFFKKYYN